MVKNRRTTLGVVNMNRRRDSMIPSVKNTDDDKATVKLTKKMQRMSMLPRVAMTEEPEMTNGPAVTPSRGKTRKNKNPTRDRNNNKTPSRDRNPKTPSRDNNKTPSRESNKTPSRDRIRTPSRMQAVTRTDPRPISDKAFFNTCLRKLMNFLSSHGYDNPLKLRDLNRPSGREFNNMATFLFRKIDPTFNDGNSKFEDEVATALRALAYPCSISKTALVAAGSPHTWPTLLLALIWLVELLEEVEAEDTISHMFEFEEINTQESQLPENFMDLLQTKSEKTFTRYVAEAYGAFLSGNDEEQYALQEALLESSDKDNMLFEREIERITDENGEMIETIEQMAKNGDDLPMKKERREQLAAEVEKFYELVNQLNDHKTMLSKKVTEKFSQLKSMEEKSADVSKKVSKLKKKVDTQELSKDDVRRMNSERNRIQDSISRATEKKECNMKEIWKCENELKIQMDKLHGIVQQCNSATETLMGQLPQNWFENERDNYFIKLQPDLIKHKSNIGQYELFGGIDLKGFVSPALESAKEETSQKSVESRSFLLDLLDRQETLESAQLELKETIEAMDQKIKDAEEQGDKERQIQEKEILLQRNKLEGDLTKVDSLKDPNAFEVTILKLDKQINALEKLRVRQQEYHIAREKEVHNELNAALSFVAEHKAYRDAKLEELKSYVENTGSNLSELVYVQQN